MLARSFLPQWRSVRAGERAQCEIGQRQSIFAWSSSLPDSPNRTSSWLHLWSCARTQYPVPSTQCPRVKDVGHPGPRSQVSAQHAGPLQAGLPGKCRRQSLFWIFFYIFRFPRSCAASSDFCASSAGRCA